jgi:hypothetical protein
MVLHTRVWESRSPPSFYFQALAGFPAKAFYFQEDIDDEEDMDDNNACRLSPLRRLCPLGPCSLRPLSPQSPFSPSSL